MWGFEMLRMTLTLICAASAVRAHAETLTVRNNMQESVLVFLKPVKGSAWRYDFARRGSDTLMPLDGNDPFLFVVRDQGNVEYHLGAQDFIDKIRRDAGFRLNLSGLFTTGTKEIICWNPCVQAYERRTIVIRQRVAVAFHLRFSDGTSQSIVARARQR
jgi:hypothetical protein